MNQGIIIHDVSKNHALKNENFWIFKVNKLLQWQWVNRYSHDIDKFYMAHIVIWIEIYFVLLGKNKRWSCWLLNFLLKYI